MSEFQCQFCTISRGKENMRQRTDIVEHISTKNTKDIDILKSKANFSVSLRNSKLVKIIKIVKKQRSFEVFYDKIASQHNWASMTRVKNFWDKVDEIARLLSNIGIKAELREDRFIMTSRGKVKFFLGMDFQWATQDQQTLFHQYYVSSMKKLGKTKIKNPVSNHLQSKTEGCKENLEDRSNNSIFSQITKRAYKLNNLNQRISKFNLTVLQEKDKKTEQNIQKNTKNIKIGDCQQTDYLEPPKHLTQRVYSEEDRKKYEPRKKSDTKSQNLNDSNCILNEQQIKLCQSTTIGKISAKLKMRKQKNYEDLKQKQSKEPYIKDFLSVLQPEEDLSSSYTYDEKSKQTYSRLTIFSKQKSKSKSKPKEKQPIISIQELCESKSIQLNNLKEKVEEAVQKSRKTIEKMKYKK